jgi:hypothetical protein
VTRDLNQAAQVHGIPNVLPANGIRTFVQSLKPGRPALAKPSEEIDFGEFGHS